MGAEPLPPRPSCDQVLTACGAALDANKQALSLSNLAVTQSQLQVTDLGQQLESKNKQLESWVHNPFVCVALGLVIGMVATGYALKK